MTGTTSEGPSTALAGIDPVGVTHWFATNVTQAEPPLHFERVAGGHSCLTFIVTDGAGARFVLRRPPLGHMLATAHDVVREHRVMSALQNTGVPVPRMLAVAEDSDVNGAPFYVMSHVEGVVVHNGADSVERLPSPQVRRQAAESLVDALVALHGVDIDAVGLGDIARRTGYLDRQLKRWGTQWHSCKTRELAGMEVLRQWLLENRPEQARSGIIHGDYRLGNVIHAPDGTVVAVLDWELCTLGDPLADVSYFLNSWVDQDEETPRTTSPPSAATGFPTSREMAARYATATGIDLNGLSFWFAFHSWRSAAICEGVYRRYIDGDMGEMPADVDRYRQMVNAACERGLQAAGLS